MSKLSATQSARWRTGQHVGEAKPQSRVFIRRGRFRREFKPWDGDDVGAQIPQEHDTAWQATWEGLRGSVGDWHFEDWTELENVGEVDFEQTFDESGLKRATIITDNIFLARHGDGDTLYHKIERGYYSPYRGYQAPHQPLTPLQATAWATRLFRNAQVMVKQGYGDCALDAAESESTVTFQGLIDDVDVRANPDQLTITTRDFGQQFTDCRVFMWNKSPQLKDPIVFADRRLSDNHHEVGGASNSNCSSWLPGHGPNAVADEQEGTRWYSGVGDRDRTEWVEIVLPEGRYEDFIFESPDDMHTEVYFALHAVDHADGRPSTASGRPFHGWLDDDQGTIPQSQGHVDAPSGGAPVPYIKKLGKARTGRQSYSLPGIMHLGGGTKLVAFQRKPVEFNGVYRFAVTTLRGVKRKLKPEAVKNRWILVNDVTDIAKIIFRWAGFKEWEVETAGVRLSANYYVNRASYYIDVLNTIKDMIGYVFFMQDPTGPDSIGVPTLRSKSVARESNHPWFYTGKTKPMFHVRDRDLIIGIAMKYTDEPLAYLIRVRGRLATKNQGGVALGGDLNKRKEFQYFPPWVAQGRMGGQLKHTVHYEPKAKTDADCEVAALLIAFGQALASATCTFEIPANEQIELDDLIYVYDESTGLSTRVWVASRSSTFRSGEIGEWTSSLGGALVDTPDIIEIKDDMNRARHRGLPMAPLFWLADSNTVQPIVPRPS